MMIAFGLIILVLTQTQHTKCQHDIFISPPAEVIKKNVTLEKDIMKGFAVTKPYSDVIIVVNNNNRLGAYNLTNNDWNDISDVFLSDEFQFDPIRDLLFFDDYQMLVCFDKQIWHVRFSNTTWMEISMRRWFGSQSSTSNINGNFTTAKMTDASRLFQYNKTHVWVAKSQSDTQLSWTWISEWLTGGRVEHRSEAREFIRGIYFVSSILYYLRGSVSQPDSFRFYHRGQGVANWTDLLCGSNNIDSDSSGRSINCNNFDDDDHTALYFIPGSLLLFSPKFGNFLTVLHNESGILKQYSIQIDSKGQGGFQKIVKLNQTTIIAAVGTQDDTRKKQCLLMTLSDSLAGITTMPQPLTTHSTSTAMTTISTTTNPSTSCSPAGIKTTTHSPSTETPTTNPLTTLVETRELATTFSEIAPVQTTKANTATPDETTEANIATPAQTMDANIITPSQTTKANIATPGETTEANNATPAQTTDANTITPSQTTKANTATPGETTEANNATPAQTTEANPTTPAQTTKTNIATPDQTTDANTKTPSQITQANTTNPAPMIEAHTTIPVQTTEAHTTIPAQTTEANSIMLSETKMPETTALPGTLTEATALKTTANDRAVSPATTTHSATEPIIRPSKPKHYSLNRLAHIDTCLPNTNLSKLLIVKLIEHCATLCVKSKDCIGICYDGDRGMCELRSKACSFILDAPLTCYNV